MLARRWIWVGLLFVYQGGLSQDSLKSVNLPEVVVTATRNERLMGALPMPVSLVSKSQIATMGSLRLTDVLGEQTGLAVVTQVNGQGSGIQLQGLNPDYTLILLNGEPLIGRSTGSLELGRVTVGNIRQVEIVKGPSSSLYGSDALAGVINIITDPPHGSQGNVYARYGSNQTVDLSGNYSDEIGRLRFTGFVNRFSTDGYDLAPEHYGKTLSPFTNYTASTRLHYALSPKTNVHVSGRYFTERQQFDFEVITAANDVIRTSGEGSSSDWNFNPVITHRFGNRLMATARFYSTRFQSATTLVNPSVDTVYYADSFRQSFVRPELNVEYFFSDKQIVTFGLGENLESVQTQRYGDASTRNQTTRYVFLQDEWNPMPRLRIISGARLDHNTLYGSQVSPKLSARYELSRAITLKASYGVGFKAPDFRQLYLNFNNSAAGGYSVLGSEVVTARLSELDAQGQLQGYLFDPSTLGKLEAERSRAFNVGGRVELGSFTADLNGFHNSIDNLIETQAVAITKASQTIYSYRNIKRVYTQGLEANLSQRLSSSLTVRAGYQLLYAMDADVVDQIDGGTVFWRDPQTLATKRLKASEYFGLYNRSRHMGNVKLFYAHPKTGWEASMRVIYRGPYGVGDIRGSIQGEVLPPADINGNGILDVHDNFVEGYALVNLSVAKSIAAGLRFQVGVDNVLDYTNRLYIPNIPGRLLYASIGYSFSRKIRSDKHN
ncbi:MAG: TonB-dependent receptor [Cytophagales bacterium]|nr:TonB-dependent receptor [Cytophagales bacterium]